MWKAVTLLLLAGVCQDAFGFILDDPVEVTTVAPEPVTQLANCSDTPYEVVFVLDSSGSVGKENFTVMKNFVNSVIDYLNIGDAKTHVGVITFNSYPVLRIRLTDNTDATSLKAAIDGIPYNAGITETNNALDMLNNEGYTGARNGVAKVAIVLTDGNSFHPNATAESALKAQNNGINMFAIGIGTEVNLPELSNIASNPDVEHIFRVSTFSALQNIVRTLTTRTCRVKYIQKSTVQPPVITTPTYIDTFKNASEICNETIADILFILDASGSLTEPNFNIVKQFVINLINTLDIGPNFTQVGVITFSNYPRLDIKLGQYQDKLSLINAVNVLKYYPGTTATDKALDMARIEGFIGNRPDAPNIAIVVTDGHSTSPELTKPAAQLLKNSGATVFAIGVGLEIDKDELNLISSLPNSEFVFFVSNFTQLKQIESVVSKNTCEVPSQVSLTTTPPPCIAKVADVVFVIDSSGSVGSANFGIVKNFMKQMIDVFDISPDYTRIGVITYNDKSTMQFGLNVHNSSDSVKSAVDNIVFTSGGTNTGGALESLRLTGFNNERPGVPNIAIIVTDGLSVDPVATTVQAKLLKDEGDVLIAIGVGKETNQKELKGIASVDKSTGNDLVYQVGSYEALQTLNKIVAKVTCGVQKVTGVTIAPTLPVTTSEQCIDTIDNCADYGPSVCSDYKPWAMARCAATCKFCEGGPTTPAPVCQNNIPNCQEYGTYICTTVSVIKWTKKNCALYCNFCSTLNATSTAATTPEATSATAAPPSESTPAQTTLSPQTQSSTVPTTSQSPKTPDTETPNTKATESPPTPQTTQSSSPSILTGSPSTLSPETPSPQTVAMSQSTKTESPATVPGTPSTPGTETPLPDTGSPSTPTPETTETPLPNTGTPSTPEVKTSAPTTTGSPLPDTGSPTTPAVKTSAPVTSESPLPDTGSPTTPPVKTSAPVTSESPLPDTGSPTTPEIKTPSSGTTETPLPDTGSPTTPEVKTPAPVTSASPLPDTGSPSSPGTTESPSPATGTPTPKTLGTKSSSPPVLTGSPSTQGTQTSAPPQTVIITQPPITETPATKPSSTESPSPKTGTPVTVGTSESVETKTPTTVGTTNGTTAPQTVIITVQPPLSTKTEEPSVSTTGPPETKTSGSPASPPTIVVDTTMVPPIGTSEPASPPTIQVTSLSSVATNAQIMTNATAVPPTGTLSVTKTESPGTPETPASAIPQTETPKSTQQPSTELTKTKATALPQTYSIPPNETSTRPQTIIITGTPLTTETKKPVEVSSVTPQKVSGDPGNTVTGTKPSPSVSVTVKPVTPAPTTETSSVPQTVVVVNGTEPTQASTQASTQAPTQTPSTEKASETTPPPQTVIISVIPPLLNETTTGPPLTKTSTTKSSTTNSPAPETPASPSPSKSSPSPQTVVVVTETKSTQLPTNTTSPSETPSPPQMVIVTGIPPLLNVTTSEKPETIPTETPAPPQDNTTTVEQTSPNVTPSTEKPVTKVSSSEPPQTVIVTQTPLTNKVTTSKAPSPSTASNPPETPSPSPVVTQTSSTEKPATKVSSSEPPQTVIVTQTPLTNKVTTSEAPSPSTASNPPETPSPSPVVTQTSSTEKPATKVSSSEPPQTVIVTQTLLTNKVTTSKAPSPSTASNPPETPSPSPVVTETTGPVETSSPASPPSPASSTSAILTPSKPQNSMPPVSTGVPTEPSVPTSTGTPETPTTLSSQQLCAAKVADILFVIDSSGSVGNDNFQFVKNFIKKAIGAFEVGVDSMRIGLITYNDKATLQFGLLKYNNSADLEKAITGVQFTAGLTNTGAALETLRRNGFTNDRPGVPNIAIVITDGLSSDPLGTKEQASLAKSGGSTLIAIGVGNQTDQDELNVIASKDKATGKNLIFEVTDYGALKSVEQAVINLACKVAGQTNPPVTVVTTENPSSPQTHSTCVDTVSNCEEYGRGMCSDYKPWANAHCKKYCGFCINPDEPSTTPKPCVDNIDNCQEYGTYICTTVNLLSWTKKNCLKYCGLCGDNTPPTNPPSTKATTPEPVCKNKIANCNEYGGKKMCSDPTYASWAGDNCREYCGFCTNYVLKQGVTLPNNETCPDWRLPKDCTLVQMDPDCCPLPKCPEGYVLTAKAPNEQ